MILVMSGLSTERCWKYRRQTIVGYNRMRARQLRFHAQPKKKRDILPESKQFLSALEEEADASCFYTLDHSRFPFRSPELNNYRSYRILT